MPASRLLTALVVAFSIVSGLGVISAQTPTADESLLAASTALADAVRQDGDVAGTPEAPAERPPR